MKNVIEEQAQQLLSEAKQMKNSNCPGYEKFSVKDFAIYNYTASAPMTGWPKEVLERAKELCDLDK